MKPYRIAALACLSLAAAISCRPGISDRETRYQVARAYGLKAFDQIDQIRYTFNVEKGDRKFRRSWLWYPRADSVVYNDTIGYARKGPALSLDPGLQQVDRWFVNDQYWILFPLHLVWDRDIAVTEDDVPQPLPTGKGRAHRLTATFPRTGGYTAGDIYHLFIGEDDRILAWIYRAGGGSEPTAVTTWEDHRHVGPITISLERKSPDGNLHVRFTDVAVKLVGLDAWLEAR